LINSDEKYWMGVLDVGDQAYQAGRSRNNLYFLRLA
jgi:hypothetical protein